MKRNEATLLVTTTQIVLRSGFSDCLACRPNQVEVFMELLKFLSMLVATLLAHDSHSDEHVQSVLTSSLHCRWHILI